MKKVEVCEDCIKGEYEEMKNRIQQSEDISLEIKAVCCGDCLVNLYKIPELKEHVAEVIECLVDNTIKKDVE